MTKIIGRLKDVGVGVEASRGVGLASQFGVPKIDISFEEKTAKANSRETYGVIGMDGNQSLVTRQWAEGDLQFDMSDKMIGVFLYALLGAKSVSGPTDSAYTHTFTLAATNQHASLSLLIKESSLSTLMYKLAMIDKMVVTITPDEPVNIAVSLMSKKGVTSTQSVTYTAENKFLGRDLSFKIAALTGNLAAASTIPLKKIVLTFQKNLVLDHNTGTVQPQDILNQGFRVFGDVELDYQDRTYADYMANGSYKAVEVKLTNLRNLIGVSSTPIFTLQLSRVEFSQWESMFKNDEIARQKFTFTALYDITNANIINLCTLVNGQASY
jgi:hypothetical protein